MKKYLIRKYQLADRLNVEQINYDTAFIGKSLDSIYSNKQDWAKEVSYYLDKEPQSCFVLEDIVNKNVVGYVFGCLDDNNHNEIASGLLSFVRRSFMIPFASKKDRKFLKGRTSLIVNVLLGKSDELKLKTPKNAGHLHINLLPEARAGGYGSKLLKTFEKYAKENGTKILHAGSFYTKVNPNENFWLKNNYKIFDEVNTSFWKDYYPKEKITLRVYYKEL